MKRQNPLDSMQEWIERMNREFAGATGGQAGGIDVFAGGGQPDADVVDRDDEFVVTVDLPGFEPDEVTARVTDQTVYVDAQQTTETDERDEQYLRRERHARSLSRQIRLPQPVDADAVTATMNNGVLTVTAPKMAPDEEGTSIDIE